MGTTTTTSPSIAASSALPLSKVGLIGPTNVGKTTYFAVLDRALRDRNWKVEIYGDDPEAVDRGIFINDIRSDLNKGAFPHKTKVSDNLEQLSFRISKELPPGQKRRGPPLPPIELTFYDPAGELFEPSPSHGHPLDGSAPEPQPRQGRPQGQRPPSGSQGLPDWLRDHVGDGDRSMIPDPPDASVKTNAARNRLFSYMKDCMGILVLLDPQRPARELEEIWRLSIESFMNYIRSNGLTHLLENNSLKARTAVLFTKADELPWFQLHRPREANWWVERHEGLESLASDMRRMCREVKFYFCSAVGWSQGRPNRRIAVLPKRLSVEDTLNTLGHEDIEQGDLITTPARRQKIEQGDLIPDLAAARIGSRGARHSRPILPLFVDPMQVVNEEEVDRQVHLVRAGLLDMPGRKAHTSAREKFLSPWNVVEPLLWAAGVPETDL